MNLAITDYYFDSSDYSSPQKININDNLSYKMTSGFSKNIKLRIRRNDVSDTTSPFFYATSNDYSFFSFGEASQDISSSDPNAVLAISVVLDNKYQTISRQVYTLGDLFGQVGGMDSVLTSIGGILVGVFSAKIYMASLLSTFYQVNKQESSKVADLKEERKDNPSNFTIKIGKLGDDDPKLTISNVSSSKENNMKYDHDDPRISRHKDMNQAALTAILRREKYQFSWKTILYSLFCFPQFNCKCRRISSSAYRHFLFENGRKKVDTELDIKFIVSSLRKANILASILLNPRQQTLLKYHNSNVIQPSEKCGQNQAEDSFENDVKKAIINEEFGMWNEDESSTNLKLIGCILGDDKFAEIKQNLDEYRIRDNLWNDSFLYPRSEDRTPTPALKEYHLR